MASLALTYDILARDQASTTFRKVGDEAERAGKRIDGALGAGLKRSLAAGAGAIAGVGLVSAFRATVGAASEAEQSVGGVQAVFKDFSRSVIADSRSADRALGLSGNAYRELATVIGSQMKNAGVPLDQLAGKTENIISIGADLAAQFGGSTQEAVNALSSAFRGELDPIERYGVSLSAAAVGAKAVEMGLSDSETELSQNAKAMATLALITEQSADAQGAFGRESDTAAGRAARAAAQWENLQSAVGEKLLPAFSGLMDVLGTSVIPALGSLVEFVADVVEGFSDLPGPVQVAVGAFGAIALLKGPVSSAFETIALKALYARDAMGRAGSAMGAVRTAGGSLVGFLGGPWGIAIGAAVTGISMLASGNDDAAASEADHKSAVQGLSNALRESNGLITDNIRLERIREAQQSGLIEIAQRAGVSQRDIAGAIDGNAGATSRLVDQLRAYAGAQTTVAQDAEGYVTTSITKQGEAAASGADKWQLFGGQVDAARQALNEQQGILGESTSATGELAGEVNWAAMELRTAAEQADAFKDALDRLTGKVVSNLEAEINLQEAIAQADGALENMNGSVLDGTGNLNAQSEAGRAAADVLLGVRDSGNELIATLREQGATEEEVRKRDADLRASFVATAEKMGIGQVEAQKLADDILGIPEERNTEINAPTDAARQAIGFLQTTIDNLRGKDVTVRVIADRRALANYAAANGMTTVGGYAFGGFTGKGGKFEPAGIVHRGEFVVPKERVDALGVRRIGHMVGMRGYADGGLVGPNVNVHGDSSQLRSSIQDLTDAMARSLVPLGDPRGPATPNGSGGLGPAARRAHEFVRSNWGFQGTIGGYAYRNIAGTNQLSKHALGKAIDVMTYSNMRLGQQIADYFAGPGRGPFGVDNVIWNRRINSGRGWTAYRGASPHTDHPHIDFYKTGTDFVPHDGLAYLHKGERVIPAQQNHAPSVRVFIGERELTDIVRVEVDGQISDSVNMAGYAGLGFGG